MRPPATLVGVAAIVGLAAGGVTGLAGAWPYASLGMADLSLDLVRLSVDAVTLVALVLIALALVLFRCARLIVNDRAAAAVAVAAVALAAFAAAAAVFRDVPLRDRIAWYVSTTPQLTPTLLLAGLRPLTRFSEHAAGAVAIMMMLATGGVVAGASALLGRRLLFGMRAAPRLDRPHALLALSLLAVNILPLTIDALDDDTPPPVFLLVVDALRADRLGSHGYLRDTTPNLDRLARDGVQFRQAISQSTFTKTSIASLLTGRYPHEHGVYRGTVRTTDGRVAADALPERDTTLAEALLARGYLTAAWVRNPHLEVASGLSQGFLLYHDRPGLIRTANTRLRAWIEGTGFRRPFFVYLHYLDLHDPYLPKPPYDGFFGRCGDVYRRLRTPDLESWRRFLVEVRAGRKKVSEGDLRELVDCHDGALRAIDAELGTLFDWMRARGWYERSLVIVTSDHGDGFLEHGFLSHSELPYEELVRVPLIVKLPHNHAAGTVIERQVRHVDILPTVLDVVGVAALPGIAGRTLRPLVDGGDVDFPAVAVTEIGPRTSVPAIGLRARGLKYLRLSDGREELYDLVQDPRETVNLVGSRSAEAIWFREQAAHVLAARERTLAERHVLDPRVVRELRALGYVVGE